MTPPMTPREKVARIVDPAAFLFTTDELVKGDTSQYDALRKADAILTALASGSGDHAELALNAKAAQTWALGIYENREQAARRSTFIDSDLPATVLALLAEIAALREDLNRKHEACQIAQDQAMENGSRAREAERKLAEAVGLLGEARGDLVATAEADTPEWSRRVYESSRADYEQDMDLPNRIGAFIASLSSKEAERG